jgi:hypothetical protein
MTMTVSIMTIVSLLPTILITMCTNGLGCRYHTGDFNDYTRSFCDRVSLNGIRMDTGRLKRAGVAVTRSMGRRHVPPFH